MTAHIQKTDSESESPGPDILELQFQESRTPEITDSELLIQFQAPTTDAVHKYIIREPLVGPNPALVAYSSIESSALFIIYLTQLFILPPEPLVPLIILDKSFGGIIIDSVVCITGPIPAELVAHTVNVYSFHSSKLVNLYSVLVVVTGGNATPFKYGVTT